MKVISTTLNGLTIEHLQAFRNLTVFPLLSRDHFGRDYLTLRAAIVDRTASLREVSDAGSVPDLVLENRGKRPVLVLEGEELVGAKQNRTANLSILAPPDKTTPIPVACVESGRWAYRSREFAASDQMHFSTGRRKKLASVHRSMATFGRPSADQGEVWSDIHAKSDRMRVTSPTNAMADIYTDLQSDIDAYVDAFKPQLSQVGAAFAIGNRIEGIELFDSRETLRDMLPKVVRSYALDAMEVRTNDRARPDIGDARAFVARVAGCGARAHESAGLGINVRLKGPGVIAGALVADGRLVHLAGFCAPGEPRQRERPEPEPRGLARLWRRRKVH